jgi:hypothetical protein
MQHQAALLNIDVGVRVNRQREPQIVQKSRFEPVHLGEPTPNWVLTAFQCSGVGPVKLCNLYASQA